MYILIYHVIGYRKKVVRTNLRNAFPDKAEAEIDIITKRYYRYLCDLILETFKTLTISREEMLQRCAMSPEAAQLFAKFNEEQRNIILVLGHWGNWEWGGNSFSLSCEQQLYVIYHPLANKEFDGLMYRMRTKFGTKLIAMNNTFKAMLANRNIISATAFIADQTPAPENAYWTNFLNQDTPVFKGTELISRKLNYPIVYVSVKKEKRGYYKLFAEVLIEEPANTSEGFITEAHTKRLEQDIIAQPENWLWSHKRWKHKRPAFI